MPDLHPIVTRMDELIGETIPGLQYAVKWKKAYYGLPELGWIMEMVAYDVSVNVVFFGGAEFDPPPPLGTTGRTRYVKLTTLEEARVNLHPWAERSNPRRRTGIPAAKPRCRSRPIRAERSGSARVIGQRSSCVNGVSGGLCFLRPNMVIPLSFRDCTTAVAAGADGRVDEVRDHEMPWGVHRQGGFIDPFGHLWLVGDRSPLGKHDLQ
jgi:hypothetical protein